MPEIIRQGDPTTHGGVVLEGSITDICHGKPIAFIGHKVQCPLCKGTFPIVEGVTTTNFYGKGIAVAGMKTACGAALIATQFTDTVEWASGGGTGSAIAGQQQVLKAQQAERLHVAAGLSTSQAEATKGGLKKITRLYWSHGPDEVPLTDVSRHYVDLNLHIETENYQHGELAIVVIENDDESDLVQGIRSLELGATIGANGTGKLMNVFRDKTVEIGTFS